MPASNIGGLQFRFLDGSFPGTGQRLERFEAPGVNGYGYQEQGLRGSNNAVVGRAAFTSHSNRIAFLDSLFAMQGRAVRCYDNEEHDYGNMILVSLDRPEMWKTVSDTEGENYQLRIAMYIENPA